MNTASSVSTIWSEEGFARVAEEVRERAGLTFPANRVAAAESGMRRAMATLGVSDAHQYAALVAEGGPALDALVAELTIGETYFFRESQQLEFVRRHVLPDFTERRGPRPAQPLSVWSAGCASGEEAYSLAIILHQEAWAGCSHVLGTDVSRPRLAAARRGEYTKWSLRGVSPDVVERYFARRGPRFVLSPQIRSGAQFRYLNLAEGGWPAHGSGTLGVDIILCRNVLMYLDPDAAAEILKRFVAALSDHGWLFLGASDPPLPEAAGVDVVITGAGLAYKRSSRQPRAPAPAAPLALELPDPDVLEYMPSAQPPPPVEALPELPPPLPEAHVEPAHVPDAIARAWQERDYPRVVELAEQDVETGTRDAAVWVVLVRALANQGRLEEAGHACTAALERHRASAELLHLHALILLQGGQPAAAAMAARRALYLDRSMVVAHMVLGSALAVLGDGAGARRAFGNVLALVERLPPDAEVPGADGETAYRIVQLARAQLKAHAGESP